MRRDRRNGFSLLEVMAIVVLLGVAAVASHMLAPTQAARSLEAAGDAQKLAAALRMARTTAVSQQIPIAVRLVGSPARVTGFFVERQASGSANLIAPTEPFSTSTSVTSNTMTVLFSPMGTSDAALQVTIATGRQNHSVSVISSTGRVVYVKR